MLFDLKSSLEELGYRLRDCGPAWRTCAVYRGGRNNTSVLIYKNSGVWYDFAENIGPLPLEKLVSLTLGTEDAGAIEKYCSIDFEDIPQPNEYIEMDKIYPPSVLENLLPSYKFYLDKKISETTLRMYKCGFSGSGKLYRRIVFPIFNKDGDIHGFSGRKIDDNDAPKWKHLGKRRNWVYPYFLGNFFSDSISSDRDIYIVESIGDSLALTENGLQNHLVTFGLGISSAMVGFLISQYPAKVYICFNNDDLSDINHGRIASLKAYANLSSVISLDRLFIKPPQSNDFGDMQELGLSFDKWLESTDSTCGFLDSASNYLDKMTKEQATTLRDILNG